MSAIWRRTEENYGNSTTACHETVVLRHVCDVMAGQKSGTEKLSRYGAGRLPDCILGEAEAGWWVRQGLNL